MQRDGAEWLQKGSEGTEGRSRERALREGAEWQQKESAERRHRRTIKDLGMGLGGLGVETRGRGMGISEGY